MGDLKPLHTAADEAPRAGVYQAVCPDSPVTEEVAGGVPRFLSAKFFAFLGGFIANPASNAVFLREVRRMRRRHGLMLRRPLLAAGVGALLLTPVAIPIVEALEGSWITASSALVFYFAASGLASIVGLFGALNGAATISDRQTVRELAVTPLTPSEIVFGALLGSLLPLGIYAVPLVPCFALVLVALASELFPMLGPLNLAAAAPAVWLVPNVVGSLLCAGAIAATVTFGLTSPGEVARRALATWMMVSVLVFGPVYLGLVQTGPFFFIFGAPVVILLKILIAGAFLNHLAWRLARERVEEWQ